MRQTDKYLQSEKFKKGVGGLGKPQGKSPAPDRIQSPRDQDRSFPCWPGSGYFGTAPWGCAVHSRTVTLLATVGPPTATQPPYRVTWRPCPSRVDPSGAGFGPASWPGAGHNRHPPPQSSPQRGCQGRSADWIGLKPHRRGVTRGPHRCRAAPTPPVTHVGPTPSRGPSRTPRSHPPQTRDSETPPHHPDT